VGDTIMTEAIEFKDGATLDITPVGMTNQHLVISGLWHDIEWKNAGVGDFCVCGMSRNEMVFLNKFRRVKRP